MDYEQPSIIKKDNTTKETPKYTIPWGNIKLLSNFYGIITLGVVAYGLFAAHVPFIIGHPWTSCDDGRTNDDRDGCVIVFHLLEIPLTCLNLYFAWFSLFNLTPLRVRSFLGLVVIGTAVNLVFFSFECGLLFDSYDRQAPTWEIVALYSIASLLLGGVLLGIYLSQKLILYIQIQASQQIDGLSIGLDGFYHPRTEDEIIFLVKKANNEGLQIRCRGSAHSVAQSIYTSPGAAFEPVPNTVSHQTPPSGPNINIMLDRFNLLTWIDEDNGIVEAEAGIHLGADPGRSTLKESFLYKIWEKGFALEDLGGITHQTISGFIMTGSAGGTLQYDLINNLDAFRVIDGKGNIKWVNKADEEFFAYGSSFGVLGIITKIRFKLSPEYFITGQEQTTLTKLNECQIDLFGNGSVEKPSLEDFFRKTPYSRIMWWPQKGSERIVTWSAKRIPNKPLLLKPYFSFSPSGLISTLEEFAAAALYTLLGVKGFFPAVFDLILYFNRFRVILQEQWSVWIGQVFSWLLASVVTWILVILTSIPILILLIFRCIPKLFLSTIINLIQPLSKDSPKLFQDYYYRSLPMDNDIDDILFGVEFTEIWIPIHYTKKVMNLLKDHYNRYGFSATGAFSNELYAGHPTSFWMHQGYTNGHDEFKDGTIRVDLFWYKRNTGTPNGRGEFYEQFWNIFRDNNIPFRLHWGKFLPDYDLDIWANYYQEQLPKMHDFLALREQRDPNNIFLTNYWKERLYGKSSRS